MNRNEIEQAAREIARGMHCRYCDRLEDTHPYYDAKCRADVDDAAREILACVEKATALQTEMVEYLARERDELKKATAECMDATNQFTDYLIAECRSVGADIDVTSCANPLVALAARYALGLRKQREQQIAEADRQAREDCARIAEEWCQYCTRLCDVQKEDICKACRIAQAVRASIKE